MLSDEHNMYPIKAGKTLTIKNIKDLPKDFYGLVKCIIKDNKSKLIRTNPRNMHTHLEIKRSIRLKYEIILSSSDDNCLYYQPDTLISGKKLFGEFVERLFWLKNCKDEKLSKAILNCLWGYLCSTDLLTMHIGKHDTFELHEGKTLKDVIPYKKRVFNHIL